MFDREGPTLFELARQALSSTDHGYDLLAPKFDHTPFRTPDVLLEPVRDVLKAALPVENALDLCCGTGAGLELLRPFASNLVGIDRSAGMLAEARRHVGDSVHLVRGDALAMPFERVFDVVTCFGAFGHVEEKDEQAFVRSIHRALRPGGRFLFVTSTKPSVLSRAHLASRAFNAVMRVRNALIRPPFIMYYLTFMLPDVERLLVDNGFRVRVIDPRLPSPFASYRVVDAVRSAGE